METNDDILKDVLQFSEKGEEVYRAVADLQAKDPHVELFAKRIARAVTAYDAGNIASSGPLGIFLLCGTVFSSIPLLVQNAAEAWLGKPWDGSASFTYIDCNAFHMVYPGMLAPLVGSLSQDGMAFRTSPLLGQIEWPHLKMRRGNDLKLLQEWSESFQKDWQDIIEQLGQNSLEFYRRLNFLVVESQQKIYEEELKDGGPFGSVIFFDGIDRASQPLHELVLQILGGGSLRLASGVRVDFSNSIIILSVHIDEGMLRRGDTLGFLQKSASQGGRLGEKDCLRQKYNRVHKYLLEKNETAAIAQSVAENLIIVGEHTRHSQMQRIKMELEKISRKCSECGVELTFTQKFIEGLADDSRETVTNGGSRTVYTEERIVSGIKRHVFGILHRLILSGKLHGGAAITFDSSARQSDFEAEVYITREGEGEALTPTAIRSRDGIVKETTAPRPEWLVELDDKAKKLLKDFKNFNQQLGRV